MKILIIGNGGREHAIGIKLLKDNPAVELFFAKGNGGTAAIGKNVDSQSVEELASFALQNNIELTIVGSEALLVEGVADVFQEKGLKIFGPHKAAALLEGDKAFAKAFMQEYGIRTATYQKFDKAEEALAYVQNQSFPLVIKAAGLAAGKGVFILNNREEAEKTIQSVMIEKTLGEAGNELVIEEFLDGFEVSVLAVCNGEHIYPMISAKDHKKLLDNDKGPNTGGMGAVAPNPLYTAALEEDFNTHILQPTLKGLKARKLEFAGVIFFGLMVCHNQCYLLEYNMRMGDPETQAILPLLSSNLLNIINCAIEGKPINMEWKDMHSCTVVLASKGYPENPETGKLISIKNKEATEDTLTIAGARLEDNQLYTSGGRVVNVTTTAATLELAKEKTYETIRSVEFEGMYYRSDIGEGTF